MRQVLHATTQRTLVEAAILNADMFLSFVKMGDIVFATLESAIETSSGNYFLLVVNINFAQSGFCERRSVLTGKRK